MTRAPKPNTPPFLLLGQILRPHGVRGELRIDVQTAYPERIGPGMQVHIGRDPDDAASAVVYEVVRARAHKQYLILLLKGINDRDEADLLRQQFVMVPIEDAVPLDDDEYYLYQLIGLTVVTDDGIELGTITDVIETGANDVYVVTGPRGEVLLPATEECIVELDIERGLVTVNLLDGLLGD